MALPIQDQETLSIRDLYRRIDHALRAALPGEVWITGEVRSVTVSSKGLCYIELVDPVHGRISSAPVVKVVCWSRRWATIQAALRRLGIVLEAGMVVRVRGAVQLYQPRGEISFVLSDLDIDALVGKVAAERARLIKALVDEDLFERNRRIPVPTVPLRIGLVASPGTEGYRDFMGCLDSSGMAFSVRAIPTQVQGHVASRSVASALRRLQSSECELIVVVRGGGSKVDLAIFDAEPVARAIAGSSKPVWTGIGHTGDQSVADQVANRSFITPTECGQELARLVTSFWSAGVAAGCAHRAPGQRAGGALRARSRPSPATGDRRGSVATRSALGAIGPSHAGAARLRQRGSRGSPPPARGRPRPAVPFGGAIRGFRRVGGDDACGASRHLARSPAGGRRGTDHAVEEAAQCLRLPAPARSGVFGYPRRPGPGRSLLRHAVYRRDIAHQAGRGLGHVAGGRDGGGRPGSR